MAKFSVSERFACRVLGQHRSTQRKMPKGRADENALTVDIIRLASRYGRYGYHGDAAIRGLGGERQTRRMHLAAGGVEGSPEATEKRTPLAE